MRPSACRLLTIALTCIATSPVAIAAHGQGRPASRDVANFDPARLGGLRYRMIGPARGGRVTAVTGVAQEPHTFYFGSTGGGVWKTTDAGITWRNVSDASGFATASIGALDVADSDPNVVYVGTGSAAIRSNVSIGKGIYKSTDAGRSWRFVGLRDAGQIGAVAIHPTNPDVVYAAVVGNPFATGQTRGVYRTRDGGATWQRVLFLSDSTGAVDVELQPGNPSVIYASMWHGARRPWT
ncbi:MAG TPA: glycosyl hydrolase, partial [Gemmatimonadaceae bacterium]